MLPSTAPRCPSTGTLHKKISVLNTREVKSQSQAQEKGQKMGGHAGCAHRAAATQAEPRVLQPFSNMNVVAHMTLQHCRVSRQDGPSRNPKAGQGLLAVLLLLSPNTTQHSSRNGGRAAAAEGNAAGNAAESFSFL